MQRNLTTTITALVAVSVLMVAMALISVRIPIKNAAMMESDASHALKSLNRRNSFAKSVFCPSIRTGIASNSSLFYRKKDKITLSSRFLGISEAVAGCDDSEYWFWIRSFDAKSIYFCDKERIGTTALRPIMRPEIMAMIAWINEIEGAEEAQKSKLGYITRSKSGPMDMLIEFDEKKILRQSAFWAGRQIVTLEGSNFSESFGLVLPGRIKVTWHEENASGEFIVDKWIINSEDPGMSPPEGLKRINLEDYSSSARKSVSASFSPTPAGPQASGSQTSH